jgi:hypothetical protein
MDLFNRLRMPLRRSEARFRKAFLLTTMGGRPLRKEKMLTQRSMDLSLKQKMLLITSMDLLNRLGMLVWKPILLSKRKKLLPKSGSSLLRR